MAVDRLKVLLPLPLPRPYDYLLPEALSGLVAVGDFVVVPLGPREVIGVVWDESASDTPGSDTPGEKLKPIRRRLEAPPLPEISRRFIDWVARYTVSSPGSVLKMAMSVPAALEPPASATAWKAEPPSPTFRLTEPRQRVLALADGVTPLSAAALARQAEVSPMVVRGLVEAGVLLPVSTLASAIASLPRPDPEHPGPLLSLPQRQAADASVASVGNGFAVMVLDGVTGSGKTEVYFEAIAAALRQERQVLVLLPEIALSAQWLGRFETRFGAPPVVWHSDLGAAGRRDTWRAVASGEARVVVGARSALFLPYPNLGLLVVDEEHDGAFKQEEGVIYHARDMAVVRAQLGKIPILLASATPSLETVVNVQAGRYQSLALPNRHAGAVLPEISAVDLRQDSPPRGFWLSPPLVQALEETFAAGEQALLFLNRRGYAPLTLCRACGFRLRCNRCSAWLVEHRGRNRLICHHCGFDRVLPSRCPECLVEDRFTACGPGIERIAEEALHRFPQIRMAVTASDTLTGPRAAAAFVQKVTEREIDLLVGTQIVAKGYHFPMLTLVGVVDADLGLEGGDPRATERTYQLLSQVAGRAGRAERRGRVLLQTYQPEHPVMEALMSGDRDAFLTREAESRRLLSMPPYGRLAAVIISGDEESATDDFCRKLSRLAPHGPGITVLGPAPAALALLRGRHRRRFLVKTERSVNLQAVVRQWLGELSARGGLRVQVDIDPYGFL